MADKTKIEWADATWNPLVGCSVVSPGCTHCYAMRDAWRIQHNPKTKHYAGLTEKVNGNPVWTGEVRMVQEVLDRPLSWRRPRRVFVNSMGDLFHERVPDEWIDEIWARMALASTHQFLVLTKRADRMHRYFHPGPDTAMCDLPEARVGLRAFEIAKARGENVSDPYWDVWWEWPLRNIWLGVSAEDQTRANERIPRLLDTPAAVRFVSAEPLLGPVDLTRIVPPSAHSYGIINALSGRQAKPWAMPSDEPRPYDGNRPFSSQELAMAAGIEPGPVFLDGRRLDWIIVGGESGPRARPMHPDWARSLRDQCNGDRTAFFFKQWGEWKPWSLDAAVKARKRGRYMLPDGSNPLEPLVDRDSMDTKSVIEAMQTPGLDYMAAVGKKAAGRYLDGRVWEEFPEAPA